MRTNPYLIALWTIGALLVVVGLVVVLVGASVAANSFTDTGFVQFVTGGSLIGVGLTPMLLALTAGAIRWTAPAESDERADASSS